MNALLRAIEISKSYALLRANIGISLDLQAGEIHAIVGENGAGKSTLMRILYGMEFPDSGSIEVRGMPLMLHSPRDAIRAGIGMVHQHFMLVPTLTVLENLVLGNRIAGRGVLRLRTAAGFVADLARRYRMTINLERTVDQLSVGEQQRIEILKTLVRGASVLLLDEPTAVLTPQEVAELLESLRELASEGLAIFIATHKLSEVIGVSNRVSVMRAGRLVGTWATCDITEEEIVTQMIGRKRQFQAAREDHTPGHAILNVKDLRVLGDHGREMVRGVTLEIGAGEVFGIAGIEGNGQRELAEAITGLRTVARGSITLAGEDICNARPTDISRRGVGHIPGDRQRDGLVLDFSVSENTVLVSHATAPFNRHRLLDLRAITAFASRLIKDFAIRCDDPRIPTRSLSGGNQQKLLLGREIARNPRLLIAIHPTRGLDIGALDYVHRRLLEHRNAGMAILLISTELDEIMKLSDRIAVLREGRIVGTFMHKEAAADVIGRLMLGRGLAGVQGAT